MTNSQSLFNNLSLFYKSVKESSRWIAKFLIFIFNEYKFPVFYSIIFFLVYVLFQGKVETYLTKIWINETLIHFSPSIYFDITYLALSVTLIYISQNRALKTLDFFVIILYIYYRQFNHTWEFWPLFKSTKYTHNVLYIDIIGAYYLILFTKAIFCYYKQNKVTDTSYYGYVNPDLPIDKSEKDTLGRTKFANQIAEVIEQIKPTECAFAIGVCGQWGSGKTSLLELIRAKLSANNKYIIVKFSPWFFTNSETLIANFFSTLEAKFTNTNKTLANDLSKYGKQITKVEKSVFNTDFLELTAKKMELSDRYEKIKKEIKGQRKELIIIIDDLDRLDKKEVIEVLKLIRISADFPNTFYLVAYDKGYITSAIEQKLTRYNATKYIEKVFNLEFKIPEYPLETMSERLRAAIQNQIKNLGDKIGTINKNEFERCFTYEDLDKFILTERDSKRFANNLIIRYLTIKEEVNFYHFFLLELLYHANADLYYRIYERRKTIFNQTFRINEIPGIQTGSYLIPHLEHLLQADNTYELFPITSRLYFYRYFSLSLLTNEFTTIDFNKSLSLPQTDLSEKLIEFNTINSPLLAHKLHNWYNNNENLSTDKLTKIACSFLFLYASMYKITNNEKPLTGLNLNNLAKLLFDVINRTDIEDKVSFLAKAILSLEIKSNFAFTLLLSMENSYLFAGSNDTSIRKHSFEGFREIQRALLSINIGKSSTFDQEVFARIQALHSFVIKNKEGEYNEEYANWHLENVIIANQDFFKKNLPTIYKHIINEYNSSPDNNISTIQDTFINIFHSTSYLSSLREEATNSITDNLVELYSGNIIANESNIILKDQIPANPNFPEFNDHSYPIVFPIEDSLFKITLSPTKSPFWRFGFRLSRENSFTPVETSRHVDEHPYIHLNKGRLENGQWMDDDPQPNLDLSTYTGSKLERSERAIQNYQNDKIHLTVKMYRSGFFHLTIEHNNDIKYNTTIKDFNNRNYKFIQFSAWCDKHSFEINTHIMHYKPISI